MNKQRYVLARPGVPGPLFYVLGLPGATDSRKQPSWTPHVYLASTWDSRYAAKSARTLAGLSPDEVTVYPV